MMRLLAILLSLWLATIAMPVTAAVTITFWSHDQDKDFPHAYFALSGVPDAGGPALDENHGFTAKAISPAILWGSVDGEVQASKRGYMKRSDAQFSVVLSDAQLADIKALIAEWQADGRYNLNKRNCVHFVAEALQRAGLVVLPTPKLMKKPRAFLSAVAQANPGRISILQLHGDRYFALHDPDERGSATGSGPIAVQP